jgi:2-polyprenyl-3-methyl-5-hydroxy-6-metoxy-1,4-benzoquinol methylase
VSEILVSNNYQVYENSSRDEMLPFIPRSAKSILDVGCSVGNFGSLLKAERSVEVWGIEIDPEAARIAADRLDKVFIGPFNRDLCVSERAFDCIVFNDVLEHMPDPYSALEYAKGLLAENGCVVASIPNVRYFGNIWKLLVDGTWEYTDSGILDRTHLRFFTKKSICSTFDRLGYEIQKIEGINPVDWWEPHLRQKFRYLNFFLMKKIADMRWLQFAVVARSSS